jgi:hypothetical protein
LLALANGEGPPFTRSGAGIDRCLTPENNAGRWLHPVVGGGEGRHETTENDHGTGTLLGMLGGVMTAAPALADGRGDGWQFVSAQPFTVPAAFCGFKVRVTFPVNKEYSKLLKTSDGTMITLTTGAVKASYTNLSTGQTITENISGPGKAIVYPDGSVVLALKGHTGSSFHQPWPSRPGCPA